jgi:putative membrane protein
MVKQSDWSVFQRQPASAIWLGLIKAFGKVVKSILPIALVVLFSSRRQDESPLELLLIVIPLLVFGLSVIDHFYFRFSITGNQLVVKKGLFARKTIILPIKKIQAVNVEQSWLHRLLGLAQIFFDSPGSEEAEVKINLNKEQAFSLKTFILGYSITEHHPIGEVKSEIVRLSFADLIRLGISANHLETLAILSGLIISFFNNIKQIIEDRFSQLYEESAADLMSDGIMLIYISIALLFASVVVSFVRIVLKFADFALSKTDTGFSLRSGLINRTEYIIPFRKIQYITWRTSWLRKRLPVYLLEYHSIGDPARNKT